MKEDHKMEKIEMVTFNLNNVELIRWIGDSTNIEVSFTSGAVLKFGLNETYYLDLVKQLERKNRK